MAASKFYISVKIVGGLFVCVVVFSLLVSGVVGLSYAVHQQWETTELRKQQEKRRNEELIRPLEEIECNDGIECP
jgi:hypothetical protein